MSQLWAITSKRLSSLQSLNDHISSSAPNNNPNTICKRIFLQQESIRCVKQDQILTYLKGVYFYNLRQCIPIRQLYDLSLNIMSGLEFDIQGLQEFVQNQYQDEDLLKVMVDLFNMFFNFVGKYYELKDNIRGIFRPNNKTLVFDVIKYLLMFTRDYFNQVVMALDKQGVFETTETEKKTFETRIPIQRSVTEHIEEKIDNTRKRRRIRTQYLLGVQEKGYQIDRMYAQDILEKAIEEFYVIKMRNRLVYRSFADQNKQAIQYPKIKIHFDHLYSKDEIKRLAQIKHQEPEFRILVEQKDKFAILKKFAENQMQKQEEMYRRVYVKKPKRICPNCKYGFKLTHNVQKPLDIVYFDTSSRQLSLNTKLPSLKNPPVLQLRRIQSKKDNYNISQSNLPANKQKQQNKVNVITRNPIQNLQPRSRNATIEKQYSIPRSKIIKTNSSSLILPNILRKLSGCEPQQRRKTNPQQQIKDNHDLRNVMAFNKIKKKPNNNQSSSVLGIISKQIYSIYI